MGSMNNLLMSKVIFTGDIHNMSMNGGDQILLEKLIVKIQKLLCENSLRYLINTISNQFYFTAKSIIEEGDL